MRLSNHMHLMLKRNGKKAVIIWADVYCSLSWKYKNVSQGILARGTFNGRRSYRKAKTLQYVKDSQQEYEARRSSQKVSV